MTTYRTMCPCGCGLKSARGCFIKGHRPPGHRFWPRVNKTDTCWLWTGAATAPGKYGRFRFNGKLQQAHHVAWILAGGTIPDGMQILHTCDTPACVCNDDLGTYTVRGIEYERRGHLFIATVAVNMDDMAIKGRAITGRPEGPDPMVGEDNPRAVLAEDGVREIRRLADGRRGTIQKLARRYGVTPTQIRNVVLRKSWRPHQIWNTPTVSDGTALYVS